MDDIEKLFEESLAKLSNSKTFESGGRGKKQCEKCKVYVGVKTSICPKCSYEFNRKKIINLNDKFELDDSEYLPAYISGLNMPTGKRVVVIYTPSGKCPINLNSSATKEEIYTFCQDIVDYGLSLNKLYVPSSIKYWVRQLIRDDKLSNILNIIDNWFKEICSNEITKV